MQAIICVSMDEFNTINDICKSEYYSHVSSAQFDKWAYPIIHPVDGRIAIPVDRLSIWIEEPYQARIVTLSADWFPVPPPPTES